MATGDRKLLPIPYDARLRISNVFAPAEADEVFIGTFAEYEEELRRIKAAITCSDGSVSPHARSSAAGKLSSLAAGDHIAYATLADGSATERVHSVRNPITVAIRRHPCAPAVRRADREPRP